MLQVLLILGILFEMIGLGLIMPLITIIATPSTLTGNPQFQEVLSFMGNPSDKEILVGLITILVIVYTLKGVFQYILLLKQAHFSKMLSRELAFRLFKGYLFQPYKFSLNQNSAILVRNIENEISTFSSTIDYFFMFQTSASLVIGVLTVLMLVEPLGATFLIIFFSVFGYLFFSRTKIRMEDWSLKRQHHQGKRMQHLFQGINGSKDIKILGRENYFLEQFSSQNKALNDILRKVLILQGLPKIFLELLLIYGLVFLILIMLVQGLAFNMMLPTIGVLLTAAFRLIPAIGGLMSYGQGIKYGLPSIDLLYKEFSTIHTNEIVEKGKILKMKEKLEVIDLHFQYDNTAKNTIDGINITINQGDFIGFVGASGSGKSTLVDVVLGLLEPKSGFVHVDNIDIHNNLRDWQNQIGYVPQTIYLTDDTLRHNIALGISDDSINEEALKIAIKSAQLDGFIENLPLGLETIVGERGVRLSGGQRQRIGIARALYHNPSILVLDEATSSLDTETEKGVMESINLLQRSKTIIIVAHRLSTVEHCDKLYKIERGKVVAQGTPKEVIKLLDKDQLKKFKN
jgi:ATP-binding cassette, subfamily B, bacterial PglK